MEKINEMPGPWGQLKVPPAVGILEVPLLSLESRDGPSCSAGTWFRGCTPISTQVVSEIPGWDLLCPKQPSQRGPSPALLLQDSTKVSPHAGEPWVVS